LTFPTASTVHVNKLQKEARQIKGVMEALLDALDSIETDSGKVAGYIRKQWKLTPALAQETQRLVRPTLVPTGKLNFEDVQEFLDTAYDNGLIQQKANSRTLMDYGLLDEVLKTRRAK